MKVGEENVLISFDAADYNLPDNLFEYNGDIMLRLTYSEQDRSVYDCKVVNKIIGEIYGFSWSIDSVTISY